MAKAKLKPNKGYLLALDLSMDCVGLVIFDLETHKPILITFIQTNDKLTHGERLYTITKRIREITKEYPPVAVAIERGFSRFNVSTQVTYRVHGVVNCMFWNVPQFYYPPKSVKEAIINGGATKKAVQKRILEEYPDVVFDGNEDQSEDESDAFAVGLTYMIKELNMEWKKQEVVKKKRKKKENK